jgi:predicted acyl esterase
VRDKVPDPENVFFEVEYPDQPSIKLAGHFWFNAETLKAGKKCPAIVEFNPYRRRDGTMIGDAKNPWFAYNDYLCFRIDLQGTGDSEGVITDEYTDEELSYCVQVISQIAEHPACDGNVGMMGKSWSAINSLMVAARQDRPKALKAVIVCDGSDDRYNDDVHYIGGAMMFDNVSWPSSMFGWVAAPPIRRSSATNGRRCGGRASRAPISGSSNGQRVRRATSIGARPRCATIMKMSACRCSSCRVGRTATRIRSST